MLKKTPFSCVVYLGSLVYSAGPVQPNKRDKPNNGLLALADFFSILLETPASAPDNDAGDHHRGRQEDDLQIQQRSFL